MKLVNYLKHSISDLQLTIQELIDNRETSSWSKNDIDSNKLPFISKERKLLILDAIENDLQIETIFAIENQNQFHLYNSIQYHVVKEKLQEFNLPFKTKRKLQNLRLNIKILFPFDNESYSNIIQYLDKIYD